VGPTVSLAARQRFYRWWVWVSLAMVPVALVAVLASAAKSAGPAGPGAVGEPVATVDLHNWLASKPSPLPGGHVVDWQGAVALATSGGVNPWSSYDEDFAVQAKGRLWRAVIEVAVVAPGEAVAISGPDLEPYPSAVQAPASGPWPGTNASSDVPSTVSAAISAWANAYCSGNPAILRLAVGDVDPAHVYAPLAGVGAEHVAAVWYAGLPDGDALAQVDLWVRWAAQRSAPTQPMVLDVLVARASLLAPLVVSWGPAGTGPELHAYQPLA